MSNAVLEFLVKVSGATRRDIEREFGAEGTTQLKALVKEGLVVKSYDGLGRRRIAWYDAK